MTCQENFSAAIHFWRRILPALWLFFLLLPVDKTMPQTKKHVSLIVHRGSIHMMDESLQTREAMAVDNDTIVALGTDSMILSHFTADRIVDADGADIFPGFIDSHAHLLGLGENRHRLMLTGTTSPEEIAVMVARRAQQVPAGSWIFGRGWDQNNWSSRQFPTKELLDQAAPNHPVFLVRVDGHAAWVNTPAMRTSGITASSDTTGGIILRDQNGEPNGLFLDNAVELIRAHIPPYSITQLEQMYSDAIFECHRYGITQVHDMGLDSAKIDALIRLVDRGDFPFRLYALVDGTGAEWDDLVATGRREYGRSRFILGGLKLYADGALGSRGALLHEPYVDAPETSGIEITSEEEIAQQAKRALNHGLQVAVHAIGDRANHIVLNAYSQALTDLPRDDHRLRIEHVQLLAPEDIPRFRELGVLPCMQPVHCTSDMYWVEQRIGPERTRSAYAWQSLRRTGVIIPAGSDFPVEHPNPLAGMYAAVSRRNPAGVPASQEDIGKSFQLPPGSKPDPVRYRNGWHGEEALSRVDAIRAFTSWAAYASFQENHLGTLEPGKFADFVFIDRNILSVDAPDLLKTRVLRTFIAGEEVYSLAEETK